MDKPGKEKKLVLLVEYSKIDTTHTTHFGLGKKKVQWPSLSIYGN